MLQYSQDATAPPAPTALPLIPLVNLSPAIDRVRDEVLRGFKEVLDTSAFVGGPRVAEFEAAFARFCSQQYCVGVGNGTDALEVALRAVGVEAGDEVIVPANSFAASAEAVSRIGATPVFVDVLDSGLIDAERISDAVSTRTTAIIPVHLYGHMADMPAVNQVAQRFGLAVIEDAAQAHGARQRGVPVGATSAMAAYSFYPGKNLGAFGDGGAVTTDDPALARRARMIAQHGAERRYEHEVAGFNSRLDALQAVVLLARLRDLHLDNALRRHVADRYADLLWDFPLATPAAAEGDEPVWHLYVVHLADGLRRDDVLAELRDRGVEAGIHYPVPLHLTGAFRSSRLGPGDLPRAEFRASSILSLPMFPQLRIRDQERVVEALVASGVRP